MSVTSATRAVTANPVSNVTGTRFTRILGWLTVPAMLLLAALGLVFTPADAVQGDAYRIVYIHVPSVWIGYLAFIVTGVTSALYLWRRTRSLTWDRIAGASADVGVLYVGITLVTGALWGRITWGKYWVWDARLTSTALLFVTYLGYLAVRSLGGSATQRARRSAIVAMLAVVEVPLVHYSVNRWKTLHQQESITAGKIQNLMLFTIVWGTVAFTMLYVWLVLHRQRLATMADLAEQRRLDDALDLRRAEPAQAVHKPAGVTR